MMYKKGIAVLLCAVMVASSISGCGNLEVSSGVVVDDEDADSGDGGGASEHTEEKDLDAFDKISVDIGYADVRIEKGNGYHLGIHISKKGEYAINSEVKDNMLVIHSDGKANGISSAALTITIPEDSPLNSVEVKTGAGDISVQEISIEELHIDTGAGDCDITGCELGAAEIDTATGDVTIMNSGTTADSVFSLSANVGDIEIDGDEVESPYKAGNGEKSISVKTAVGDIIVNQ